MEKQLSLFRNEEQRPDVHRNKKEQTYEEFVNKFKPKKTTDDCYTPPVVYDTIFKYINDNYIQLDGYNIIRPFYPGGDYLTEDYRDNDFVFDNPPFSILSKIIDNYIALGVKFFLFAPHLTLFQYGGRDVSLFVVNADIIYENGARVGTDFVTNMYPKAKIIVDGEFQRVIKIVQKETRVKRTLRKLSYPPNLITSANLGTYIANRGGRLEIRKEACQRIKTVNGSKGKSIFGSGFLISDNAVLDKEAAEREAAEREAAIQIQLSKTELRIISKLNKNDQRADS